ncbi:MAG: DUF4147 domain-containing protein, partial [Promethearchaeota archaeon]
MQNITQEFERLKNNGNSLSLKELRGYILEAFYHGLKSVDPRELIKNAVEMHTSANDDIKIKFKGVSKKTTINLSEFHSVLIIGGGKATGSMTDALIKIIGDFIGCYGLVNIPHGQNRGNKIEYLPKTEDNEDNEDNKDLKSSIDINYSAHPIPDINGLNGTKKMLELVKKADEDNSLILVLISGGGSALMPFPRKNLNLEDLRLINFLLLESGANINEINSVRKHLSGFKGGNLAKI